MTFTITQKSSSGSIHGGSGPSVDSRQSARGKKQLFSPPGNVADVRGSLYSNCQVLIQQVAYSLSGNIFSYCQQDFIGLDHEIRTWNQFGHNTSNGPSSIPLISLSTRVGAASAIFGYMYNQTGPLHDIPQTVLASAATLHYMEPVLAQHRFGLQSKIIGPLSFQVAAIDYDSDTGTLVTDYTYAMSVARNLDLPLIVSNSHREAQDIALLSCLLSSFVPTIHTYDGVRGIGNITKVDGVLPFGTVRHIYNQVISALQDSSLPVKTVEDTLIGVFQQFNIYRGSNYKPFEYIGCADAETVIVTFGSIENNLAGQVAENLARFGQKVGAINVRLYSPFLESQFLNNIPKSVKHIHVFGQVSTAYFANDTRTHSALFADISSSLGMNDLLSRFTLHEHKYPRSTVWKPQDFIDVFAKDGTELQLLPEQTHQFTFWDISNDAQASDFTKSLTYTLSADAGTTVDFISTSNSLTLGDGMVCSQVRALPALYNAPYAIGEADVVVIGDIKILEHFNVLTNAKHHTKLLIIGVTDKEILEKSMSSCLKKLAGEKSIQVFGLDESIIENLQAVEGRSLSMSRQIAFWKIAYPHLSIDQITAKIVLANGSDTELVAATVASLVEMVINNALKHITVSEDWIKLPISEEEIVLSDLPLPTELSSLYNIHMSIRKPVTTSSCNSSSSLVEATKQLVFPEAYNTSQELRPDLPSKNFIVKVQLNQRVTPSDYDRHIFHLELDISGTGLTYDIGEALGVHAPNNENEVLKFLNNYGIPPDEIIRLPSKDFSSSDILESRTALQYFCDNLDLFGKPQKRFYSQLSEYALDKTQKAHLERLSDSAGAAELKRRIDVDFDTYVDVLEEFFSARPSLHELVQIIPPLKRREYSIASSQKVHPNAVHLLIVVVDWIDSRGRKRYGQCSKYLADLRTGSDVIVSVKPSVMKLPVSPISPIIMSGLGTGLAPFKAFLEEKAWQKSQGIEIGPIYLFLGSRHQRQEYLYGELFEAYRDAGILTYIGAAFSRDQPDKVYIQDRIREARNLLIDVYDKQKGTFYLCGPTWPVPDISAALIDIVSASATNKVDPVKTIEELKEQHRYILEVY